MSCQLYARYFSPLGRPDSEKIPRATIASNGPIVAPMSALVAEVEAVEAEDMEAGLDYWLPGDVGKRVRSLQLSHEEFLRCPYRADYGYTEDQL